MLTKEEHYGLAFKVDCEGFDYYMMDYGPDYDSIKKLGYNIKEVKAAVKLLKKLRDDISNGLDFEIDEEET